MERPQGYLSALLQRNHNISYKFPNGYLFFKVIDYEDAIIDYNQYNVIPKQSSTVAIGTGSAKTWNAWNLNDSLTYDIFKETMSGFMLQAFIGINIPDLKLWKQFPAPTPRGNLDQTKITTLDDSAPGYISGDDNSSPYDAPTALSEMLIPCNFPQLQFGIYNVSTVPVMPRFRVIIRRMQVRAYDPRNPMDKNTINDIISGRRMCKVFSPGLDGYQYAAQTEYGVAPMKWEVIP